MSPRPHPFSREARAQRERERDFMRDALRTAEGGPVDIDIAQDSAGDGYVTVRMPDAKDGISIFEVGSIHITGRLNLSLTYKPTNDQPEERTTEDTHAS
jgi:hypothetical protein